MEDRYKTIVNLAPDVIYTLSRKGILTSLSPSFERITGFKTSDWIGRHFAGLIHPDDLAQAIKIFRQTMRGQTVLSYELRILSKKGGYLTGEFSSAPEIVNGKIVGKIGIARDITRHKQDEEKLRQSRDHLKVILENVVDGITVQRSDGSLEYVNNAAAIASGYRSSEEMLENPTKWTETFELKTEDGQSFPLSKLPGRRVLGGEIEPREVVGFLNKKTGEEGWSIIKARPIFDEFGKVYAVVNIINDITQRMELERRKDDFIGIASHELKTPVTSIKGYIHLLKREHKQEDKHTGYLIKVDKQLDKLTELIQDLLDLGRIQGGKLIYRIEKFHMADLIRDVVSDLQRITPERRIILKNGIKRSVKGDRDRIAQVLINLITNAIKYSPRDRKVLVKASEDKGNVHIAVRDYGIGIEKSEMDKIFDRFYRVKDSRGKTFPGLGIGLYLSSEIVTRHNGKIWVESGKGQGSTFHFTLPAN